MRIIRVFPRRTSFTPMDNLAIIGEPPLPYFLPIADQVHISVTFTWDKDIGLHLQSAWRQYYSDVRIGGPAFDDKPAEFIPGKYVRSGVTFTSRGCNNDCPFCLVPGREGPLFEYRTFAPGNIIQDNNLAQASRTHIEKVCKMLSAQPRAAVFSGGIDPRRVSDWLADKIRGLRVAQLFLSADDRSIFPTLERAIKRLSLPRNKTRVYALIGYNNDTLEDAADRLETIWKLGGLPFAQLYQPADHQIKYSQDWRDLARIFSRPAATVAYFTNKKRELK